MPVKGFINPDTYLDSLKYELPQQALKEPEVIIPCCGLRMPSRANHTSAELTFKAVSLCPVPGGIY